MKIAPFIICFKNVGGLIMTPEQIEDVIRHEIRPFIEMDGGGIDLVKLENNVVYVRLRGACVECPKSMVTLKDGVEDLLKSRFKELKEVVAI